MKKTEPKSTKLIYKIKKILIPIKKTILQISKPAYEKIDIKSLKEELAGNKIKLFEHIENYENELAKIKKEISNNSNQIIKLERDNNVNTNEIIEIKKDINFYTEKPMKYLLYFHSGSDNRGCEALVKTIIKTLNTNSKEQVLFSFRKNEDLDANINNICKYIYEPVIKDKRENLSFMGNSAFSLDDMGLSEVDKITDKNTVALSIGGDNYCYGEYVSNLLSLYNSYFKSKNIKTALIGCSVEPDILNNESILSDLKKYDLIIARESITYDALINAGINNNTHLAPDTAFNLETINLDLPDNFIEGKTIGINMSPLILENDNGELIYNNYYNLIKYIIEETEYNVALIPHVFWERSNDFLAMVKLYDSFVSTRRISIIGKHSSEELKGYISRCKMFVGARTHATIAAYSSIIPTVVIGYSVKSKGIAHDLFGTYENYVVPIENIKDDKILVNSFLWLEKNYNQIREQLKKVLPNYIKRILDIPKYFDDLKNRDIIKALPSSAKCTGCSACMNICPVNCIKMVENDEGFLYPTINYKKCINCELCKNTCPIINDSKKVTPKQVLAIKNKDDNIRYKSSSGGVFYELAKYVINKKGVVFGAAYSKDISVEHIMINNLANLLKLQGSKYSQSNLKDTFKKVKKELDNKKLVLFSGTPCHIHGLKSFLNKNYINLICVDIVCHGVPSPKVFSKYIREIEKNNNSKVNNVEFRNKENGWKNYNLKLYFDNKKFKKNIYSDDVYMKGFLQNLYLRPSCHNCNSNNFRSGGDITLGDCWGIEKIASDFDDDKGVSLIILNTKQGCDFFNKISSKFDILNTDINFVIKENPSIIRSWLSHKNRKVFFENIDRENIIDNINNNLE